MKKIARIIFVFLLTVSASVYALRNQPAEPTPQTQQQRPTPQQVEQAAANELEFARLQEQADNLRRRIEQRQQQQQIDNQRPRTFLDCTIL